jgi:LemA protein
MLGLIIVAVVLVVLVLMFIGIYNGLVRLRNAVRDAWSQIDVQLKRRHDLIPNLVETVKGYVKHERETLENVTKARAAAAGATDMAQRMQAEQGLTAALGRLFAVAESYPDLKANQNFIGLQEELASTENRISFARQHYNDMVMQFNNKIEMFPSSIIAGMFNFERAKFFEIESPEERKTPQVKF